MKTLRIGWVSVILALALGASAWSAEIPATLGTSGSDRTQGDQALDKAGLPHDEAVSQARSMDRVELAQLERTDLNQRGGELATLVMFAGICLLLMWIFTVCESKQT